MKTTEKNHNMNTLDQIQKIGQAGTRVCLWNPRLAQLGFPIGTPINIRVTPRRIVITPVAEARRKVAKVTNHGKVLPVIDLKQTKQIRFDGWGESARVVVNHGIITVTPFNNGGEA
mgnify:FL=1